MSDLYRERIIDHYRHPRNQGVLGGADISGEEDNPLCGDQVRLDVQLTEGRVSRASFSGRGCVLSLASASMLTQEIEGKATEELEALGDEDVFRMMDFRPGPVRAKCALLPLRALQRGLARLKGR